MTAASGIHTGDSTASKTTAAASKPMATHAPRAPAVTNPVRSSTPNPSTSNRTTTNGTTATGQTWMTTTPSATTRSTFRQAARKVFMALEHARGQKVADLPAMGRQIAKKIFESAPLLVLVVPWLKTLRCPSFAH